jgi:transcriptional regulator of acetoin/glycerol metabolism
MLDAHETCISWLHMPDDLVDELQTLSQDLPDYPEPPPQNLQQLSQKAIEHALENARGNVSAAARQLGISRQTMYRKLQDGALVKGR